MTNTPDQIEDYLLQAIDKHGSIENTLKIAEELKCDHQAVVGSMKSLETDFMIVSTKLCKQFWALTDEAEEVLKIGSPEIRTFNAIPDDGITPDKLKEAVGDSTYKVGFSYCMKNKMIKSDKTTKLITKTVSNPEDSLKNRLQEIKNSEGSLETLPKDNAEAKNLVRRQMISFTSLTYFSINKGEKYSPHREKLCADLTKEMLDSGAWKDAKFKEYNFNALGKEVGGGHLHPLLKVREEFRKILLEMGFAEMPTNRFVESSFWDFDALFVPQSHPARDLQDTFFIKDPEMANTVPEEYMNRVKQMHSIGGHGSFGYGYEWKKSETMKNVLRTHTTCISGKMLYELANSPGGFKPVKYFSIDRVFRNETLDATHLAEFHQIELFVADRGLTLGNLIGMIYSFFAKIGITNIRFKPAFNPYTEPSMEIFGYHPDLKKWTEIGNSGIFRPELLLPMGLPEDVVVVACGLSLERPTMIKYGIDNIRELFGHKFDLELSKSSALPRF